MTVDMRLVPDINALSQIIIRKVEENCKGTISRRHPHQEIQRQICRLFHDYTHYRLFEAGRGSEQIRKEKK